MVFNLKVLFINSKQNAPRGKAVGWEGGGDDNGLQLMIKLQLYIFVPVTLRVERISL